MWKLIKLKEIINLQNGYAFKSKDYSTNGHFVMRITNVQKGYISNHNPRYYKIKQNENLKKYILKENDILVSLTGDVGRVGIIKKINLPCLLNQRVAKIEIIDEKVINKDYLFFFLNSNVFIRKVENLSHGTAQKNVSTKDILEIRLNLPSLQEQSSIVTKLNKKFKEINNLETINNFRHQNIKVLRSSFLKKFLNCNSLETKIGDVCELVYGKGLPKSERTNMKSEVPIYGANGIKSYTSKALYKKESIIVGRKGSAGELKLVDKPFWALDVTYYTINNDKKINLKYLFYILKSLNLPSLARGVKPGINRNDIYNIKIRLPEINKQKTIVKKLEKMFQHTDILLLQCDKQLENYHTLKSSIIYDELRYNQK